jgi:hypothetical protein
MKELKILALTFLPGFLAQFLSDTQIGFMLQYRKLVFESPAEKMVQGNLLGQLDGVETIENLNKLKQRIRKSTMAYFKHPALDSAHALAIWLNRYFPLSPG